MFRYKTLFTAALYLLIILSGRIFSQDYCIPPFFDTYGPDPFTGITDVTLEASPVMENASPYDDKYSYYSSVDAPTLETGQEYNIELSVYTSLVNLQNSRVWIDWNRDYDFNDPGEMAAAWNNHEQGIVTAKIKVPMDAKEGITRMRVYTDMNEQQGHLTPEPCGYLNHTDHFGHHGNVEDYNIRISKSSTPFISLSSDELDFGDLAVDQTKEMSLTIENSGYATLEISGLNIEGEADGSFSISSNKNPLEILPGKSIDIQISFTPQIVGEYDAFLTFESNAANNDDVIIKLAGRGENLSSVTENSQELSGYKMKIFPNPSDGISSLEISVSDFADKTVSVILTDISGKNVKTLFEGEVTTGMLTMELNLMNIRQGRYLINLEGGDSIIQVPIIIIK